MIATSFNSLNLHPLLLAALEKEGFNQATNVQGEVIPQVLALKDTLVKAQTGTGKTASFILPLLDRFIRSEEKPASGQPWCLILAPTRELAIQIKEACDRLAANTDIKSTVIYGGVNIGPQTRQIQKTNHIIIATPGRLLDHLRQENLDLSVLQTLVLDEADRLLDMGFERDINKIKLHIQHPYQCLLFSATFSKEIEDLANEFLNDPVNISIDPENPTVKLIEQTAYLVEQRQKAAFLYYLFEHRGWHQVLIFTKTKVAADDLADYFNKRKIKSTTIHSDKTQNARIRALDEFKQGKVSLLIATDIAARGLDIEQLPFVINYDLPPVAEDYVHRIGRTGRAGHSGLAISLVDRSEEPLLTAIEDLIDQNIHRETIENWQEALDPNEFAFNNSIQEINKQQQKKMVAAKKKLQAEQQRKRLQKSGSPKTGNKHAILATHRNQSGRKR